jgi:hypothetical protein
MPRVWRHAAKRPPAGPGPECHLGVRGPPGGPCSDPPLPSQGMRSTRRFRVRGCARPAAPAPIAALGLAPPPASRSAGEEASASSRPLARCAGLLTEPVLGRSPLLTRRGPLPDAGRLPPPGVRGSERARSGRRPRSQSLRDTPYVRPPEREPPLGTCFASYSSRSGPSVRAAVAEHRHLTEVAESDWVAAAHATARGC